MLCVPSVCVCVSWYDMKAYFLYSRPPFPPLSSLFQMPRTPSSPLRVKVSILGLKTSRS